MKKITKNKKEDKEYESGDRLSQKFYCIADELIENFSEDFPRLRQCGSSDAMDIYEHINEEGEVSYDAHCWSCAQVFSKEMVAKSSHAEELGVSEDGSVKEKKTFQKRPKAEPLTTQEAKDFMKEIGFKGHGYRGISDEANKFYGHLTKVNKQGEVVARYYPETDNDGKIVGFKCRNHPKNFKYGKLGLTGITNQLSGQVRWKKGGGKYLLIVGGEEDKAAAYQMFSEYNKSRGQEDYDQFPIVSPTTGEGSAYKQLSAQYDWIDTFDNIYLALDSDKAGKEALVNCIDVLPAEKVHIVTWSGKDPNDMLQKGKHKQFIRDFYNAKPYIPDTVKTSKDADDEMEIELSRPKIPLPSFMKELQKLMAGGIPLGYLVNLGAQTGGGKTTIANEMIYYWIFNSPYKIGILSLELNAGQYQTTMLSRHIGHKIQLIEDPKEAVEFVQQDWVQEKRRELREHDNGEPRYVLLDGREGTLVDVKKQIDKLIKKYDCKFIVIDPINDLFEGVSLEEQTAFIKYLKGIISDGISIINICHITKGKTHIDKNGNRVVRKLTEDDFSGVSNIAKSGGCNIFATRDKLSEDPVMKNVTEIEVPKCRWTGRSGKAGMWYYDNESHTIHDYEEFFGEPPSEEGNEPKKKFSKPKKPANIDEDKPPFEPDNVEEDINPFDGE
ncbi:DNA primase/helicase [Alteromonas phage vB_AmeM_PT11-V22]|uniref:DNA primase-helicase n=1 Tax=Alteromonas phage vB_AmeM_PT11-V22 TaxID=2704031 RepID=A0A6C0R0W5_9CAUD|nr:DNA primase/helicase [Alteromonas phage vB_AmeM_PT11-V22]QHZ59828.1 DNA primase-helicase [Alteromonas phage vB_AmeM_PT11-V22]